MKRRILIIALCVFAAVLAWMPVQAEETYDALIARIDRCLNDREWGKAEELLIEALKREPANPNNCLLISNLGTVHRNMGKPEAALTDYNTALAIAPNATAILRNRASLYLEMDSVESAFDDFKKISSLNPKDVDSRYYMGIIALEFGDMVLSLQCFEDVLALDEKNADARRGLALWKRLNGYSEEAIALYGEIIKSENRATNYMNRAECYLALGQLQEAQSDISEAQKLEPSNPDVYLLKARLAELSYRYDDAASYARQALTLGCEPELAEPFLKKRK